MTSRQAASTLGLIGGLILALGCGAGPPPPATPAIRAAAPAPPTPADPCPPLPYEPNAPDPDDEDHAADASDGAHAFAEADIAAIAATLGAADCDGGGLDRANRPDRIAGLWRQGHLVLAELRTASGRRAPTARLVEGEAGWTLWDRETEARSIGEQQARLGRWLQSHADVEGLYSIPLPGTERWRLARLDAGLQSEVCVYTDDGALTRCWAGHPGLAVIGHIPLPSEPGPGRLLLWTAPEGDETGPVACRVLELATGRLCMAGEIDRGEDGGPASGVLPDPAPCPPSAAAPASPGWLDLTRRLFVQRLGGGPIPLGLGIRSDLDAPLEQYPRSLCLSAPDGDRTCRRWIPPGDGGFDVDVIGVGPPVGDPPRWPVSVRINWIGSHTDVPAEDRGVLLLLRPTADGWREDAAPLPIGEWSRVRYVEPEGTEIHRRAASYEPTALDARTVSLTLAESSASHTTIRYSEADPDAEPQVTEVPVPVDDAPHKCCAYDGAAWQCVPRRCPKTSAAGGASAGP